MGQDKALMDFLGAPLIVRVMERLAPLADEIIVTTNNPEGYRFMDVPLFPDLKSGRGALGGLYTAVASAKNPLVAVVACDMPFASAPLFAHARDVMLAENADVVIPLLEEGFEPIHALYRRETCLPAIERAIAADRWKVISWFPDVKVRALPQEEIERFDPDRLAFWNVNTPEEFQKAQEIARNSK
jgi:molybdopterin-guanine dinucleotide biosynthesis protein A